MKRSLVLALTLLTTVGCGPGPSGTANVAPVSSPSASPTAPQVFPIAGVGNPSSGTMQLTHGAGTYTLRIILSGLAPNSSHIDHIHLGSCTAKGGIFRGLSQVVADAQGKADVTNTLEGTFPPDTNTYYVVVHAGPDLQGSNGAYLLCGNLFA